MSAFTQWISDTSLSLAIRESFWLIPMIQIAHIVAIAMIVTAAVVITARSAGLASRTQTMRETAQQFLPWIWTGLWVLAPTGIVLIIAEPQRTLGNVTFWWKMAMLLVGVGLTAWFQVSLRHNGAAWEDRGQKAAAKRVFAASSILIWIVGISHTLLRIARLSEESAIQSDNASMTPPLFYLLLKPDAIGRMQP